MKKKISIILSLIMILSTLFSVSAFAASYPNDISSNKYIEFRAQQNINVYKDTACKTRGTSSPSKKYNASISKGDDCYIYKITSSYIQVNYPTSSGRRTGYIKRTDLFDKTASEEYISSAKAKVTVYKTTNNSYIEKGDKVWRVDPKNGYSGYRAVIYEAKSGKRGYKMGYITLDDLDKLKKGEEKQSTNNKTSNIKIGGVTLDYALGDYFTDNGKACSSCHSGHSGNYATNEKYCNCKCTTTYNGKTIKLGAIQCMGFTRYVQTMMYGCNEYSSSSSFKNIGGLTYSAMKKDNSKLKDLITKAGVGAHIRTSGPAHSMIVSEITDKGFTIIQANGSNNSNYSGYYNCRIGTSTYTWSSYVSSTYGARGIASIKVRK